MLSDIKMRYLEVGQASAITADTANIVNTYGNSEIYTIYVLKHKRLQTKRAKRIIKTLF